MSIPTLTAEQAAERLRAEGVKISADTIRQGIQQGAFPFGVLSAQAANAGTVVPKSRLSYPIANPRMTATNTLTK